jgi:VanZ family protein
MKRLRHISLTLFCIYVIAVILLCVAKTESLPELPKSFLGIPLDKMVHFLMFMPFPILGHLSFLGPEDAPCKKLTVLALLCITGAGFALSTEQLQALTAYRSCESADMFADFLGLATGAMVAVIYIFRKRK